MLLIGLTGSIATGKSTVSSLLQQPPYSLPVIDADLLARKVVEPGTRGYRKIVNYFGPTTPDLLQEDPDGKFKEHGAPLRLAIPVKYGIKSLKQIGTIRFTDVRTADFWAELGFDWYAGH